MTTCDKCKGRGGHNEIHLTYYRSGAVGEMTTWIPCPECKGTGKKPVPRAAPVFMPEKGER